MIHGTWPTRHSLPQFICSPPDTLPPTGKTGPSHITVKRPIILCCPSFIATNLMCLSCLCPCCVCVWTSIAFRKSMDASSPVSAHPPVPARTSSILSGSIRQCGSQGQTHDCTLTTGSNQDTINTLRDLWMCPKERSSVGQCKKVLFTLFTTLRHYHTNFYPCTFVSIFTKHFPNTWTEISHNTFVPLFACGRFDTMVAFSYLLYVFVAKCHCVLIRL